MGAVYVYGVVPAGDCPSISAAGVKGGEVTAVEHGALAALVSPVHGDTLAAAREVRAHWRVLEKAFQHGTVLPCRFGTVMESEDAVRERLLEPNTATLTQMLDAVDGCVQLGVKGRYREHVLLSEIVRGSPAIAELRGASGYADQIRLGELVAGEVARRREEDLHSALEVLEPFAVGVREEEIAHEDAAFSIALLVERGRRSDFDEAVAALRRLLGERVDVQYVGPMPPYSFAEADLATGSAAWA